jgi:NAD(P)-dependent dehydrogenase (short-subunit alcohol dehydrogenase family)
MFDLSGKSVLIVGVGLNMGLSCARMFLKQGAQVAISDLRTEMVDQAAAKLSESAGPDAKFLAFAGDVRDEADCKRMVDEVVAAHGKIDVLVSCVGRSSFGLILEMDKALFEQEVGTNLTGNFLIAQAVCRQMVEQGTPGRVILFGSGAGVSARKGGVSHCSSKAALHMFAKVLAIEVGQYGITVNVVSPGLVPKDGTTSNREYREAMLKAIPVGRYGAANDMDGAVAFLSSDESSFVTGAVLQVDGGSSAGRAGVPVSVSAPRSSF